MLWIKTFHILFVTSWFAGLFYLPRIYVNLAQTQDASATACLLGMARRLYRFMTPLAVLAVALGLWLFAGYGIGMGQGWMHAKLAAVVLLIRSEEHTSELQSLMRISYAVFCLKKKNN